MSIGNEFFGHCWGRNGEFCVAMDPVTGTAYLRLRNDLYCVEWGVKLYSLTHSAVCYLCWV